MAGLLFSIGEAPAASVGDRSEVRLPPAHAISFDLASGGCWYGHGFAHRQPYPLNREPIVNEHFAVNNCQSPIWMCSAGWAILAETTAELAVRCNAGGDGRLRICCPAEPITLRLFRGPDLPAAHGRLLAHLGWPNTPPDRPLLGDCIFCTWTQYPRCITQERILDMAAAIRRHGYPCSTITIDDRWESAFGELQFSADFPDPGAMVRRLHEQGFRVLLWVTPFVNQEARTFRTLGDEGLLVRRRDAESQAPGRGRTAGAEPALLRWWGGTAGLIDLTNPAARDWFRRQLLRLKNEVGVDGFKIDGGDAKYQPPLAESAWAGYPGPSGYADELLAVFEEVAPGRCETRTVWRSQRRNILWRQGGKDSHWGPDNGLAAMVRLGLHMALTGYDIFIPDMIPGRVRTMIADMDLPTDELAVRWTEASAFMPIMQYSYFPWNYAAPTADVMRDYALVHKALESYLVEQSACRSAPLYRPLWYDLPGIEEFYSVDDQFMLGPDLVVAPVLAENQVARDVLLPPGAWRDAWTGGTFSRPDSRGPAPLRLIQHPAPCPGIPVFVRAENPDLFNVLHEALNRIARRTIPSAVTTAAYSAGLDRDLKVTG